MLARVIVIIIVVAGVRITDWKGQSKLPRALLKLPVVGSIDPRYPPLVNSCPLHESDRFVPRHPRRIRPKSLLWKREPLQPCSDATLERKTPTALLWTLIWSAWQMDHLPNQLVVVELDLLHLGAAASRSSFSFLSSPPTDHRPMQCRHPWFVARSKTSHTMSRSVETP